MSNNNAYPDGKCNDLCAGGHPVLRDSLFSIPQAGDRVRLTPKNPESPTVEGIVRESYDTFMHIQGLGFTQFQEHHFDVQVLEYKAPPVENIEAPAPTVTPEAAATATLLELLGGDHSGDVRLSAAKLLLEPRF